MTRFGLVLAGGCTLWAGLALAQAPAEAAAMPAASSAPLEPSPPASAPVGPHAQQLPDPAEVAESSADRKASERYEAAVRAELHGKRMVAQGLAQEALDLAPTGRYAPAIRRLLDRLETETLTVESAPGSEPSPGSPLAARIAYVVSGGLLGVADGTLIGVATNGNGSVIAGAGLAGAAVGLGLTALTLNAVQDGSPVAHLWVGASFGAGVAGSLALLDSSNLNGNGSDTAVLFSIAIAAGAVAGALVGAETDLTDGDAMAGFTGGLHLPFLAAFVELAATTQGNGVDNAMQPIVGGTTLALGVLGLVGGELANRELRWSAGRWGLIDFSAWLGIGLGAIVSVLAGASEGATFALLATGDALGLGVGVFVTQGLGSEGPATEALPPPAATPWPKPPPTQPGVPWGFSVLRF